MTDRTKMSSLLIGSWVGEATVVEFLRSLPPDKRDAAGKRILASLLASIKDYADQKLETSVTAQIISHRMTADEMARNAEPAVARLLDLAKTDG